MRSWTRTLSCVAATAAGLFALPALGQPETTWDENSDWDHDAGSLPATADRVAAAGSVITRIVGTIAGLGDADVYALEACNQPDFSATITTADPDQVPSLYLFDENGRGLALSWGGGGETAIITSTSAWYNGRVYLAVSYFGNQPQDPSGAPLWADFGTTEERAPDGPGAANPVAHFEHVSGGPIGSYTMTLNGACFTSCVSAGGAVGVADTTGNGNSNGSAEPGEGDVRLQVPVRNWLVTAATGVTATLTSLTDSVSVLTPASSYPNLAPGATGTNLSPFVVAVSPAFPCGDPMRFRLQFNAAEGQCSFDFVLASGIPGGRRTVWKQNAVATIPDNSAVGVSVPITVAGVATPISDVDLRFDGTSPSTSPSDPTTGIGHANVGELVVRLTSPEGTTVTLINRAGSPGPSTSNNFRQLRLDDAAANSIQSIGSPAGPIAGSFIPANPLSAFNGEDPNGVWTLTVADVVASPGAGLTGGEGGRVRNFSLVVANAPECAPLVTASGACCTGASCAVVPGSGACAGAYQGNGSACGAAGNPTVCCPANFDQTGGVQVADIFAFLSAWFAQTPASNFNGDATVDVADIFAFLSAWFAGCA